MTELERLEIIYDSINSDEYYSNLCAESDQDPCLILCGACSKASSCEKLSNYLSDYYD